MEYYGLDVNVPQSATFGGKAWSEGSGHRSYDLMFSSPDFPFPLCFLQMIFFFFLHISSTSDPVDHELNPLSQNKHLPFNLWMLGILFQHRKMTNTVLFTEVPLTWYILPATTKRISKIYLMAKTRKKWASINTGLTYSRNFKSLWLICSGP